MSAGAQRSSAGPQRSLLGGPARAAPAGNGSAPAAVAEAKKAKRPWFGEREEFARAPALYASAVIALCVVDILLVPIAGQGFYVGVRLIFTFFLYYLEPFTLVSSGMLADLVCSIVWFTQALAPFLKFGKFPGFKISPPAAAYSLFGCHLANFALAASLKFAHTVHTSRRRRQSTLQRRYTLSFDRSQPSAPQVKF